MKDSRSKLERNGWKDGAQSLAPEIRAARMLLTPAAQEEISNIAEDMELTLLGNQPTRTAHSQRGRRCLVGDVRRNLRALYRGILATQGHLGRIGAGRSPRSADGDLPKDRRIRAQRQKGGISHLAAKYHRELSAHTRPAAETRVARRIGFF